MPIIKDIVSQDNGKAIKKPSGSGVVFKRGKLVYVPIPAEVFKRIIGDKGKFFWTELDKTAQLASEPAFTTIPALSNPETVFGIQRND